MILDHVPPNTQSKSQQEEELPEYRPPSAFERAQYANDTACEDPETIWDGHWDEKRSESLLHIEEAPGLEMPAVATRPALSPHGSVRIKPSGAVFQGTTNDLLAHVKGLAPPKLTVSVKGRSATGTFAVTLQVDLATAHGGSHSTGSCGCVPYVVDEALPLFDVKSRSYDDALETGCAVGCVSALGGRASLAKVIESQSDHGQPRFLHLLSLVEVASPTVAPLSAAHTPSLHRGLFIDYASCLDDDIQRRYQRAPPAALCADMARRLRVHGLLQGLVEQRRGAQGRLQIVQEIFGWDKRRVEAGIIAIIHAAANGEVRDLQVTFNTTTDTVELQQEGLWNRVLFSDGVVRLLLCLCLIYPVVYIVSKFLAPRPATICLAYPLVYWKPSPASPESGATGSHSIISGSHGGMSLELAGLSEQVWLASVEEPLRAAVKKTRRRSSEAEKIL